MTAPPETILLGGATFQAQDAAVDGGFTTIDGERYARIANVDQMPPFLMSIVSDSDVWLFVGSNGPFTAGRGSPDAALFPYQTVDKILRDPASGGARTILLVSRGHELQLWEPWQNTASVYRISRHLYKRIDGAAVVFEEVNHDLGIRFRWSLAACAEFGLIRRSELAELTGAPVEVRYLDGWHELIPPGVDADTYARVSYLATAYMRHERLPGVPLALYSLNAAISDRPEPSESLRMAAAWSVGHRDPVILISDRQVEAFRRGFEVESEGEVRGEVGAYLVADRVALEANGAHAWFTVGDTHLDHAAILDTIGLLAAPERAVVSLEAALAASQAGVRRRVAGADGLQESADEAASANHFSNVLFNIMRGGSFDRSYAVPVDDLAGYLRGQNGRVFDRHRAWIDSLAAGEDLRELRQSAVDQGDPQLTRLVRSYLPLTYSRRHGDPSRPWNQFSIRLKDSSGQPIYGFEGNWRDIFQNWDALGQSFPDFLPHFINVFLNASTADGYNPYRITRAGIDWEVADPRDPWSNIGYWGDHQIVYLLRLLEAYERHAPGELAAGLGEHVHAYASVPYRIADFDQILADPRTTIDFDRNLHDTLIQASQAVGADGRLIRDESGEVSLISLAEKLLVPLLVKLTNFVPGGGIWLNTQRPEWNDANNALAGWGLSVVTLSAIRRYLLFLGTLLRSDADLLLSKPVADLLGSVTGILSRVRDTLDDDRRYRVIVELGRAGEAHRRAVYAGDLGDEVPVATASIRAFVTAALPAVEETLRASRRLDGLYHAYNLLRVSGSRASVEHLGPMLEGQVAILDSGLLSDHEAVGLLRDLRVSAMYRAEHHSYLLYPDRVLAPILARNTLAEEPPITDPSIFVKDRLGTWHFQADLSTVGDIERRLAALSAAPEVTDAVLDLWRATFAYDEFTGRSGTFFMFEGLGSIYWHMVAKLLLAIQGSHRRAIDPGARVALAEQYDDVRDGLGFRKTPLEYGAFPTDPYSHTPSHHGAQQPGMTGQVKEQILSRFGELGVDVADGCVRFDPRLLHRSEFLDQPGVFRWIDLTGTEQTVDLSAGSLAFTYCQTPIVYRLGDRPAIELQRTEGGSETVDGDQLSATASRAIVERSNAYRVVIVTIPRGRLRAM
ncbi:MAG: hypothetical protein ABI555_07690 [Chloroflexota bacterium]